MFGLFICLLVHLFSLQALAIFSKVWQSRLYISEIIDCMGRLVFSVLSSFTESLLSELWESLGIAADAQTDSSAQRFSSVRCSLYHRAVLAAVAAARVWMIML